MQYQTFIYIYIILPPKPLSATRVVLNTFRYPFITQLSGMNYFVFEHQDLQMVGLNFNKYG